MVKLNDTSKGILGEASKKIGTYQESTGGGTPLAKGEKLKDHPEAKRVKQPRDDDGKFTYNSVNGKELKYGPSRGVTVPPFLRDVKLTFCQKGTKLKIDGPDGIKIKIMTIDMTKDEIIEACKEYLDDEKGFLGMGEGSSITKKGRKSEAEKKAKAGQIGYVDPSTLSKGTQQEIAAAASKYAGKNSFPSNVFSRNSSASSKAPVSATKPTPAASPAPAPASATKPTPVTPSGSPASNKLTTDGVKNKISGILSKISQPSSSNNGGSDKFSKLNASTFANLFKKGN